MRKAFIFTLDALFAVSLLVIFLTVVSFELNVPKEKQLLPETGNNFMTALDKSGVFFSLFNKSDQNASKILSDYLSNLPQTMAANISVKIYRGNISNDVFTLQNRTIQASKGTVSQAQKVRVKRIFSNPSGNYFGIVELVLSYG